MTAIMTARGYRDGKPRARETLDRKFFALGRAQIPRRFTDCLRENFPPPVGTSRCITNSRVRFAGTGRPDGRRRQKHADHQELAARAVRRVQLHGFQRLRVRHHRNHVGAEK